MSRYRAKSDHCLRVEVFMIRANQATPQIPGVPDDDVRRLRAALILEEALETIHALGYDLVASSAGVVRGDAVLFREHEKGPDLIEIADGCADISVVNMGTLIACGIADQTLLAEVDESNFRKFGPGGYRAENGKWMKPANWRPPNIAKVLLKQGWVPPLSEDDRGAD